MPHTIYARYGGASNGLRLLSLLVIAGYVIGVLVTAALSHPLSKLQHTQSLVVPSSSFGLAVFASVLGALYYYAVAFRYPGHPAANYIMSTMTWCIVLQMAAWVAWIQETWFVAAIAFLLAAFVAGYTVYKMRFCFYTYHRNNMDPVQCSPAHRPPRMDHGLQTVSMLSLQSGWALALSMIMISASGSTRDIFDTQSEAVRLVGVYIILTLLTFYLFMFDFMFGFGSWLLIACLAPAAGPLSNVIYLWFGVLTMLVVSGLHEQFRHITRHHYQKTN